MRDPMPVLFAAAIALCVAAPTLGQVINEDLKLLSGDGTTGDWFGCSIAIDNGIVAAGAYQDDDNGLDSGSAYLFDATTGAQIAKLLPSDGAAIDYFGYSIAIDNGVVAVGAPLDDDNGTQSGSAYLFDAFTGAQIAKLLPSDGAFDDFFGYSIAIDNGVVAVGAYRDNDNGSVSGSVYLFDASTGTQVAKLVASDGAANDQFGFSIAINNGVVAIGAVWDDDHGSQSGSAYLFDASTGAQLFKLLPQDGTAGDEFGWSIAIDNGVVAVGASSDDHNGSHSGSAYLFNATTGEQLFKLLPIGGAAEDWFGTSIAIANGVVAVGSNGDVDNGPSSGSAYLFDASTGAQTAKLLPSDGATDDEFGWSIGIDNGVVAVGAVWDTDNGDQSGSAYVFGAFASAHLALTTSCPSAGPIQINWTDATPNGNAALLYARNTGSFAIPNNRPCPGTVLGLGTNQLQIVFTGPSDSNGSRTINTNTSAGACGGHLQLLDLTTCDTSNVARIE